MARCGFKNREGYHGIEASLISENIKTSYLFMLFASLRSVYRLFLVRHRALGNSNMVAYGYGREGI